LNTFEFGLQNSLTIKNFCFKRQTTTHFFSPCRQTQLYVLGRRLARELCHQRAGKWEIFFRLTLLVCPPLTARPLAFGILHSAFCQIATGDFASCNAELGTCNRRCCTCAVSETSFCYFNLASRLVAAARIQKDNCWQAGKAGKPCWRTFGVYGKWGGKTARKQKLPQTEAAKRKGSREKAR